MPSNERQQLALGRLERDDAEVDGAQQDFLRHLPRRNAPHLDEDARMVALERLDQRQHRVHAAFVRADEHAALLDVAQVGDRAGRLVDQTQQPVGVLEQQLAGVGQRAVARRPIDQPLAGAVLEPPDRLADRRLRPAKLAGRPREAPLGGDGGEHAEILEGHRHRAATHK